jgi:hypothetical protein
MGNWPGGSLSIGIRASKFSLEFLKDKNKENYANTKKN